MLSIPMVMGTGNIRFLLQMNWFLNLSMKTMIFLFLERGLESMMQNMDSVNSFLPKNILMIGPTGVGKTEISRRLSKLAEAPFVKVEATRFTEVGYVGRDVEQIVRDLIEIAISMEKVKKRKEVYAKAQKMAEEKVLDALVGKKQVQQLEKVLEKDSEMET